MTDLVKNYYPPSQPRALATYTFTEFTTNLGYIPLYLAQLSGSQILTTNSSLYSWQPLITDNNGTIYTFSTTFNRAAVISGDAYFNLSVISEPPTSSNNVQPSVTTLQIYKNSTLLISGSVLTGTSRLLGGSTGAQEMFADTLTIPTTKFGIGDVLNLKVGTTATLNPAGSAVRMAVDPANRSVLGMTAEIDALDADFGSDVTQSKILIPVRAEIY